MGELSSVFARWETIEPHPTPNPDLTIRMIHTADVIMVRCVALAGYRGPLHRHDHLDQLSTVTEGVLLVTVGDEQHLLHTGEIVIAPAGVAHETFTETGATFFETFGPLDGRLPFDDIVLL